MFRLLGVFLSFLLVNVHAADYVGSQQCQSCHTDQFDDWHQSHHDHAMEVASPDTVLGNFDGASFEYSGVTSTFSKRTKKGTTEFWVKTDNADGKLEEFKIDYTFGVYPLQQYLIGFDDGRYQALSIAWDSRPKVEGGQRWFHLYPDEAIGAEDMLHWTGEFHTWNSRCAACHSTNLQKNYDLASDSYNTLWSEIDVGCESCHGRASEHLSWAKSAQKPQNRLKGFEQSLQPLSIADVLLQTRTDKPIDLSHSQSQIAVCGSCHSRRSIIGDVTAAGDFHDAHRLSLLEPNLYHADGQIQDEVYVLGSFLQSKMYHQGVVCSHCHNPHSLKPKFEGNALCTQCHAPTQYNSSQHHHHKPTSSGAQCVNCHMPETTYMVVDPRRDHSLKIPRPDLSIAYGTPNACNQCHQDKSTAWASEVFTEWLQSQQKLLPATPAWVANHQSLDALQADLARAIPDITEASILSRLASLSPQMAVSEATKRLADGSPLVRATAARALKPLPFLERFRALEPLMTDESRSVRIAVAESLASQDMMWARPELSSEQWRELQALLDDYGKVMRMDQDFPEGLLNLGLLYTAKQDFNKAKQAYEQVLQSALHGPTAALNLADLYRQQNDNENALKTLDVALQKAPNNADLQHALGLALVREQRYPLALSYLEKAAGHSVRYRYVYTVALHNLGDYHQALAQLRLIPDEQQTPDLLSIGLDASLKLGQRYEALEFVNRLLALNPSDPAMLRLKGQLESMLYSS